MRVSGHEVISRPTQVAARSLYIAGSAALAIEVFSLKPYDWPILSSDLAPTTYDMIMASVLVFFMTNLFVHWWADRIAFQRWFKTNRVARTLTSEPGSTEIDIATVRAILERFEDIKKFLDGFCEANRLLDSKIEEIGPVSKESSIHATLTELINMVARIQHADEVLLPRIDRVRELLDEMPGNFDSVSRTAKFLIYFWYFGFPVLIGVISFLLIVFGWRNLS